MIGTPPDLAVDLFAQDKFNAGATEELACRRDPSQTFTPDQIITGGQHGAAWGHRAAARRRR